MKLCPFCGGHNVGVVADRDRHGYFMLCAGCGATGPFVKGHVKEFYCGAKADARMKWDDRAETETATEATHHAS